MPELPEVETVRATLDVALRGVRIISTHLERLDVLRPRPARRPRSLARRLLAGATIAGVERRGKQLALIAGDGRVIAAHLGMTGTFRLAAKGERLSLPHTHAVWRLETGGRMIYADVRRFGYLAPLASRGELDARWSLLGPDALTIDDATLHEQLRRTRRAVKAAILDQGVIAGVGNIYADEALHRARVSPWAIAGALSPGQTGRIAAAIREIMTEAIAGGGSSIRDYRSVDGASGGFQLRHRVYGRGGEACRTCGRTLLRAVLAQRATVWCGTCQRTDALD